MTPEDINVLSVLPIVGHPRDSKRISMIMQSGFRVSAIAFERDYHTGRMPDCDVTIMGKIAHGRYFQRLLRMMMALPKLRQAIRSADVSYCSGADMAFMAFLAGIGLGKPVVVEIGDIREVQVLPGLLGWVIRRLDRAFINSCALLVATTPAFVEVYYRQWLGASVPALVIENKLEADFAAEAIPASTSPKQEQQALVERPLRIGYFGGLRCEWTWRVLKALALARPTEIEIVLAGYVMAPADLLAQVEGIPNVEYRGQYRSPQDLPGLYGSVDLIWGCYQPIGPDDWNLRWARPNRFYESCYFQVPIVSRAGSCDSEEVARYNIGFIVSEEEENDVVEALGRITPEDLATWQRNMSELPAHVCTYTTETDKLTEFLLRIVDTQS